MWQHKKRLPTQPIAAKICWNVVRQKKLKKIEPYPTVPLVSTIVRGSIELNLIPLEVKKLHALW